MIEHGQWFYEGRGCNVALADGRLYIERQDKPNLVGGISRGKVDRVIGKSAFVKLPHGGMGYLDKAKGAKPGDELLVQVSGYASEDKAWPLSTELKLQGRRYIYLPHGRGIAASKRLTETLALQLKEELTLDFPSGLPGGWIIRSGGNAGFGHDALQERMQGNTEAKSLIERAKLLDAKKTDWLIPPPSVSERAKLAAANSACRELSADDVADRMERLLQSDISLHSGGRLRLGPTPALFTIDMDAGSQTNMNQLADEAAEKILHVLRSRNVAGQIVIDPVRASVKDLLSYLKLFSQNDSLPLTIYGQTKMGLIELSRPRFGPSLYEALDD